MRILFHLFLRFQNIFVFKDKRMYKQSEMVRVTAPCSDADQDWRLQGALICRGLQLSSFNL